MDMFVSKMPQLVLNTHMSFKNFRIFCARISSLGEKILCDKQIDRNITKKQRGRIK